MAAVAVGVTRTLDVLAHAPMFSLPLRLPRFQRLIIRFKKKNRLVLFFTNPVYYPNSGNLALNRIPLSTKISILSEACT
jgi:hypothetical protein